MQEYVKAFLNSLTQLITQSSYNFAEHNCNEVTVQEESNESEALAPKM